MQNEFSSFIHNYVLDSQIPARDLAKALGKPYSTLLREVNPYDSGAKLGAESLFQIMSITGNYKPLEFMAEKLGIEMSIQASPEIDLSSYTRKDEHALHVKPGAFHAIQQDMKSQSAENIGNSSASADNFCPNCGNDMQKDKRI